MDLQSHQTEESQSIQWYRIDIRVHLRGNMLLEIDLISQRHNLNPNSLRTDKYFSKMSHQE